MVRIAPRARRRQHSASTPTRRVPFRQPGATGVGPTTRPGPMLWAACVQGVEGLQERRRTYDPSRQFIFILVAEFASGDVSCQHHTVTGQRGVEDRGPCEYVTDHGRTRSAQMPKFGYAGSLRPHRVTPDRPLPDNIPRTDYYTTGQAEKERQSDARNTPPVLRATASSACTVCVNVALTVSVFGAPLGRCFRRRRSRRCAASASSDARSSTPLTASCVRA